MGLGRQQWVDTVYVLDGVTGAITNVGALPSWLALANCQLKR